MLQKLDAVPDIRPKAEEIKLAVERGGTYQISPQQIAQKKSWPPGVGIKMTVWNDLLSVLQTENELLRSLIALGGGEKQEKSMMRMRLYALPVKNRLYCSA